MRKRRSGGRRNDRLCLPPEQWPLHDREAWQRALQPRDIFDPARTAGKRSSASLRAWASGFGRYMRWLIDTNQADPAARPGERVTRERVRAYWRHLQELNNGYTIPGRIAELAGAMRLLAPEQHWGWLSRAAGRLRSTVKAACDKHARVRPLESVLALAFKAMAEADNAPALTGLQRAVLFRNGLMLAFLAHHPLRVKSFCALEFGRHVTEQGEGYWIFLPASEVKNRRDFECAVANQLRAPLRRYINHHRKVLARANSALPPALWLSIEGNALSDRQIGKIVRSHTSGVEQPPMSPHDFRYGAATAISINAPELAHIIPGILHHASTITGDKTYNLTGMMDASQVHNALIEDLRHNLAAGRRADEGSRPLPPVSRTKE